MSERLNDGKDSYVCHGIRQCCDDDTCCCHAVIRAFDAEDAAKLFHERNNDNSDFTSHMEVSVRDKNGLVTLWETTAEPTYTYWATSRKESS